MAGNYRKWLKMEEKMKLLDRAGMAEKDWKWLSKAGILELYFLA